MNPTPWKRALLRLLAVVLFAAAAPAFAATVALVTDVVGEATQGDQPLKLLAELDGGRELSLRADAVVVVFYVKDGAEWVLNGPGRYRLMAKGPEAQAGAPAAQRRPGPPAYRDIKLRLDRVQQAAMVMRGLELKLRGPVNHEVVLGNAVRFTWEFGTTDAEFEFELVDEAGTRLLLDRTTRPEYLLPEGTTLEPGRSYSWAVRARSKQLAQPLYRIGEFRIADAATRRRIEAARPKADAPFSERALFVALLEDIGASGAAMEQRRLLAPERPVAWAPVR